MELKSAEAKSMEPTDEHENTKLDNAEHPIKSYKRRFLIATLIFFAIGTRGFSQSCFGSANDVMSKFYNVEPWQVDWLTLTQAVMFLVVTMPMSFVVNRMGFRAAALFMFGALLLGFCLMVVSFWLPYGFSLAIFSQSLSGISTVASISLQTATAAIWFPANEVPMAIAFITTSRGVGEAIGAVSLSNLLHDTDSTNDIRLKLTYTFSVISLIMATVFILGVMFVKDKPELPPSIAQSKAQAFQERERANVVSVRDSLRQFRTVLKTLFTDRYFLLVWATFGITKPVLRSYTILLASVLHEQFHWETNLNSKAGFVVMGAWLLFIVGNFLSGPIVNKTKRYRAIMAITAASQSFACLLGMIGILASSQALVYVGVILVGFFLGLGSVALFSLVMEVSYPLPTLQITMLNMIGLGFMRLTYPVVGRVLLQMSGPVASSAFPFALNAFCTILLLLQRVPYRRLEAETSESAKLLSEDKD